MIFDVPGTYPSIGDAIAAAQNGDTIEVAAGRYAGCLDTSGRSITIEGDGEVVLDGSGCYAAVVTQYGEAVTLRDLRIESPGALGIYVIYSTITLDGVTISGAGHSEAWGGALYAYQSVVTTIDATFVDNTAGYGGALFFDAYNAWTDSGSTFEGNTATYNGGGVYSYWVSSLDLTGSTFTANSTSGSGGALYTAWYYPLTVRDSVFTDNAAVGNGGAIQVYALDDVVTIESSRFEGNTSGGYGGAIEAEWYADVQVRDSVFEANTAVSGGGGIFVYVEDNFTVARSRFCANDASAGGAVHVQWTTTDSFTNNQLVGNSADYGGGLYRYASYAGSIAQNTLVDNVAAGQGGASYGSSAYATFQNNIISGSAGFGVMAADAGSYAYYPPEYSGWNENDPVDAGGYAWVDPDAGNAWADPQFFSIDGCDSDLHLASGSAFRDAGHPDTVDADGSRADMGAYGGAGAAVEDADGDGFDTTADCNDGDAAVSPASTEVCNGYDDDCDGGVDGAVDGAGTWYVDADGDGYGAGEGRVDCAGAAGEVAQDGDCDDADAETFPGAAEIIADEVDQDCDGADEPLEAPVATEAPKAEAPEGCGCAATPSAGWAGILAFLALRRRLQRPQL